jgi:hypothetical protein
VEEEVIIDLLVSLLFFGLAYWLAQFVTTKFVFKG